MMRNETAVLKSLAGETMALQSVCAQGKLDGLLFELSVEQRYRNPGNANIETVYTFPLPYGAVLLGLELQLGEKLLDGVVVERKKAEEDYEKAIDQGDTAIMLERAGEGLYTVNIGNLMPGEEALIRYRYGQLLRFEKGCVRIFIPTVISPRFGEPEDAGLEPHQAPVTDALADYPFAVSIDLRGEISRGTLESPSHPIKLTPTDTGFIASLERNGHLDRDFVLSIGGLKGESLSTVGKDGDGYVALASFCPAVPRSEATKPLFLKILVDCSGSMAGDSIESAKRALHRILERLDPADSFTLSRFGSQVRHCHPKPRLANDDSIREAFGYIKALNANMGGTELEKALQSVFALGGGEGADILLITDGEVWKTESLVSAAHASGQRIFAVAVGSAPAESLHRALASQTGGACECVAPNEDVEDAIVRMFGRMRAPKVRNLAVTWPNAPMWQTSPSQIAFDGETVHVFAGYATRPDGNADLVFHAGEDSESRVMSIPLVYEDANTDTLSRIAAAERLKDRAQTGLTELALRYQLVTKDTSYFILHLRAEGEKAKNLPELVQVAQMQSAGWGGSSTVLLRKLGSEPMPMVFNAPPIAMRSSRAVNFDVAQQGVYYDIPAFLSKRSEETEENWITPQRFLGRPGRGLWGLIASSAFPTSLDELVDTDLPLHVIEFLKQLILQGEPESEVIKAFIEALAESPAGAKITRHGRRSIRALFSSDFEHSDLRRHLTTVFASATITEWPGRAALAHGGRGTVSELPY